MQSRRDQVQAQSYMYSRLTSALIAAEPEAAENPNRRTVLGTVIGLAVAGLVVVGFTVFGFVVPGGSTSWRKPGVLIVEAETGNRYVLVDDTLHPVLNYASVLMLFNGTPDVVRVSARSLAGVAHGEPIGVPGAPDTIPDATTMSGQVWTVCAVATRDAAGSVLTLTSLRIGRDRGDGPPGGIASALPDDDAMLVLGPDQRAHLIWHGQRHALSAPWVARALGFEGSGFPVERGWLEVVPAGPDVTPADLPGRGERGVPVAGADTFVGQLFVTGAASARRHYVMQHDGLSPLSEFGFAVVAGDPDTLQAYGGAAVQPTELSQADVAQARLSTRSAFGAGQPTSLPRPAALTAGLTWCVEYTVDSGTTRIGAGQPATLSDLVSFRPEVSLTALTAAVVEVEAGVGGWVRGGWPGSEPGAAHVLVIDAGVKYPLANATVAQALGYPEGSAIVVPPPLLDLLPTGPLLDPGRLGG
jgi:type VII secretion protein EccB